MNEPTILDPLSDREEREYLRLLIAEEYANAETGLYDFLRAAWPVMEPQTKFLENFHIPLICEHLEAVELEQIKRLVVNMPPRYFKSGAISVCYPAWVWVRRPEERFICSSYDRNLSVKLNVDRRNLIESGWYQTAWADRFKLSSDQNLKAEFSNDQRGHMIATSHGSGILGKGGNRIIIDDPHNPKTAQSDALRGEEVAFFDDTLYSRLDDKKKGAIIIVMQRLHDRDLSGHVLQEKGWTHLMLEGVAAERRVHYFPLSGKEFVQEEGELLWPEREGREEMDATKVRLGSYNFAAQYQQSPSPPDGIIFNRNWWKFWRELPPRFDDIFQSWDMAFKDLETSDFVVGQVWGRLGADKYLIDQVRGKMDIVATMNALRSLTSIHPLAVRKIIEETANGPAVISMLRHEIPGIIGHKVGRLNKVARARAIVPTVEAGNVYLPHPDIKPWVFDFIEEHARFPKGKNDDQVDASNQALDRCMVPMSRVIQFNPFMRRR